jgi:hypothetical protein
VLLLATACQPQEDVTPAERRRKLTGGGQKTWVPHFAVFKHVATPDSASRDTLYHIKQSETGRDTMTKLTLHTYSADSLALALPGQKPYKTWAYTLDGSGRLAFKPAEDADYTGQQRPDKLPYQQILWVRADSMRARMRASQIVDNYSYYQVQYYAQ